MIKYFKLEDSTLVNLLEHVIEQVRDNSDTKISIATDSQNYGSKTVYATVVVFRYGLRGAHYIYNKIRVPRIKDTFSRLYKEGELTMECAEYIQNNTAIRVHAVEFDYNNKKKTVSSSLVPVLVGWANSLGYNALAKPDELIAAKAADHLCRH